MHDKSCGHGRRACATRGYGLAESDMTATTRRTQTECVRACVGLGSVEANRDKVNPSRTKGMDLVHDDETTAIAEGGRKWQSPATKMTTTKTGMRRRPTGGSAEQLFS